MPSRILLLALCLSLVAATTAHAKLYRWVDENGVTVYSQTPPPEGEATEMKVRPAPKSAQTPAPEPEAAPETTPDTRDDAEEMARKQAESDKIKQQNCKAARSNLQVYQNVGNKLLKTPEGLYVRLTDEEREARIGQAQANIKEFCGE